MDMGIDGFGGGVSVVCMGRWRADGVVEYYWKSEDIFGNKLGIR